MKSFSLRKLGQVNEINEQIMMRRDLEKIVFADSCDFFSDDFFVASSWYCGLGNNWMGIWGVLIWMVEVFWVNEGVLSFDFKLFSILLDYKSCPTKKKCKFSILLHFLVRPFKSKTTKNLFSFIESSMDIKKLLFGCNDRIIKMYWLLLKPLRSY